MSMQAFEEPFLPLNSPVNSNSSNEITIEDTEKRTVLESLRNIFKKCTSCCGPKKTKDDDEADLELLSTQDDSVEETPAERKERINSAVDKYFEDRDAHRKKVVKIFDRTFFQGGRDQEGNQLTEKDMFPDNPDATDKPVDIIIAVVDLEDGNKPIYIVEKNYLRPVAPTLLQKVAVAGATGAATLGSYALFDEGILTQALFTPYANTVYEKMREISGNPVVITSAASAGVAYALNQAAGYSFITSFAFLTTIAIAGLAQRRFGKAVSKEGFSGFKATMIPKDVLESDFKSWQGFKGMLARPFKWANRQIQIQRGITVDDQPDLHKVFKTFAVMPYVNGKVLEESPVSVKLELSQFDGDAFYRVVVGEKQFPWQKMAAKPGADDDDDDMDDVDEVEKAPKKDKGKKKDKAKKKDKVDTVETETKPEPTTCFGSIKAGLVERANSITSSKMFAPVSEAGIIVGSMVGSLVTRLWIGGGKDSMIERGFTTISGASLKAAERKNSTLTGALELGLPTVITILITALAPSDATNLLAVMNVLKNSFGSAFVGQLAKDYLKDTFGDKPKLRKNWQCGYFEMRPELAKGFYKFVCDKFEVEVPQFEENAYPLEFVLDKNYEGTLDLEFDAQDIDADAKEKHVKAELKISGQKMSGVYTNLTEKEQTELNLMRLKAEKLHPGWEGLFVALTMAGAIGASALTKNYQLNALKAMMPDPTNAEELAKLIAAMPVKLGTSILADSLSKVSGAFMKQNAKLWPVMLLHGTSLLISAGTGVGEYYAIKANPASPDFAFVFVNAYLGVVSKITKQKIFGKPYSTHPNWVLPEWLSALVDKCLQGQPAKIKLVEELVEEGLIERIVLTEDVEVV